MKKIFEYIALISLLIFSFFLTDKTSTVIKNMDEIMIMIKDNKKRYETKEINALISDKYITPGISKRKVNINKSYNNMKEYGKYNPNLYIYDYIKPSISIIDNTPQEIFYISLYNLQVKYISNVLNLEHGSQTDTTMNAIITLTMTKTTANAWIINTFLEYLAISQIS